MKFSVIVPVYNVANVVDRCIKSILSQTLKDYEIIIVDDGSTDGSDKIIDHYAENNENIHVIHKTNDGLYMARVDGINVAHGDYLVFVDSDDSLVPTALWSLNQIILRSSDIDMIIYRHQIIECDDNGSISSHKDGIKLFDDGYIDKSVIINKCATDDNFNNIWLKCVKVKSDFNFFTYHHLNMAEDLALTCQFVKCCSKFYYTNEILYNYVVNPSSLTHTVNIAHLVSAADSRAELLKLLEASGNINKYKSVVINDYIKNVAWYISELNTAQLLSANIVNTMDYIEKSPIWRFTLDNIDSCNKVNRFFVDLIQSQKYKEVKLLGRLGRRLRNHGKLYKD